MKALSVILFVILSFSAVTQSLPRGGHLGIRMANMDNGIVVQEVTSGGTGASMDVRPGDVILEISGIEVSGTNEIEYWMNQFQVGKPVVLKVIRDGEELILVGDIQAKPTEQASGVDIEYGVLKIDEGLLRTITYYPQKVSNPPAILYIQDFWCNSIDYYADDYPTVKKIAQQAAKSGYAIMRVEKPGSGDSKSKTPCWEMGFKKETIIYQEAIASLIKNKKINGERISLLAHGYGGNYVSAILKKHGNVRAGIYGFYNQVDQSFQRMRSDQYWKEGRKSFNKKSWSGIASRLFVMEEGIIVQKKARIDQKKLMNYIGKKNTRTESFPSINSFFVEVGSKENYASLINKNQFNADYINDNYNPDPIDRFIKWLSEN